MYMYARHGGYCVGAREGTRGGFAGGGPGGWRGRPRGFGLTHIEVGRGLWRTYRANPRLRARWWRVVCLFVSRERASGYRKKFYLHDRKMLPCGRASARPRRRRGEPPHRTAAPSPLADLFAPPTLFRERFYLFFLHPGERARGVAKSSVGRRLKSGGGF